MPDALQGAQRLSTTFRFARNSSSLNAKARQDLQRLAAFIRKPEMAGASLVLAGFTDITGSLDHNVELSLARAESVRDALLETGGRATVKLRSAGFGPAAPVACNGDDKDRFLNRRVEVWMLDGRRDCDELARGPDTNRSGFAGRDARAANNRDPLAEAQAATARGAVIEARLIEAKAASATVTLIADSAIQFLDSR